VLGVYDSNGQPLSESAVGNRYLWQGREYSFKTGLYFFRSRYYDPITGRWLSKDRIGIAGGLNQYVFCRNNPVNRRDPFGLVDLNLFDKNSTSWKKANGYNIQSVYTVAGHGKWANPNDKIADVIGDSKEFTAKELVDKMYKQGYRDGQDVWIITCNSAKKGRSGKKSFTQRVYEELKRRTESGNIGNVVGTRLICGDDVQNSCGRSRGDFRCTLLARSCFQQGGEPAVSRFVRFHKVAEACDSAVC
jgi:RHS repeat-associated protein